MSRMYRIRVSDSVEKVVHVADGVASDLAILPILSPERTREILAAALEQRGFVREGDALARHEEEGVVITVDLASGRVTARVATTEQLVAEGSETVGVSAEQVRSGAAEARVRKRIHGELEKKVARQEEALRSETTKRLASRLRDLAAEMDGVVTRVTVAALKERAGQLGEIEEVHEDPATGELTIRVRV